MLICVWTMGPSLLFRGREGDMFVLLLSSGCDWPAPEGPTAYYMGAGETRTLPDLMFSMSSL